MALPIIEQPIYGQMTLETAAWSTPFSWVDRTADIVQGINYSIGGRVGLPGQSQVDVGTLNVTFKNVTTAPLVGDLVRFRRTGTTEYAFVGYVQDVAQRIVFDQSVSYTTPVVLTTINCLDWVGYISQFQVEGIGGLDASFVVQSNYPYQSRARALNNSIDATNATQLISFDATFATSIVGDTDMVGTISDHLDLVALTQNLYWYPVLGLPTDKTTGRDNLITIRPLSTAPSSGKTFTDVLGSAGQLHYTEIDLESSSQNVANSIVLNNFSLITSTATEVTKKGGANKQNFAIVNGVEKVSVPYTASWSGVDATSITTYGNRATEFNTNIAADVLDLNLVGNPSMEYGDDGWATGANRMARRKPAENGVPFAATHGEWALRYRLSASATTPSFRYSGSENDGIPIVSGVSYKFQANGLRGLNTNNDTRVRAFLEWQNNAGGVISTSNGSQVSLSTAYAWGTAVVSAAAPANAERVIVGLEFSRSGGGTFAAGQQLWLDAALMNISSNTSIVTYFDGDSPGTNTFLYLWTGEVGLSQSFQVNNNLDETITTYLTRYSTTSNRVTRIRWNAQEDLTSVSALRVGSTVSIVYKGTTTSHRIVGVDGNVSPDRYMIDYYLEKV